MAKSRSAPSAPLFESVAATDNASRPLADRLRPASLAEVIGQDHLLGEGGPLRRIAEGERPRLDDLLGAARNRQDDGRAAHGARRRHAFRAAFRDLFRRAGPAQGLRREARDSAALRPGAHSFSSTRSTASTVRSRTPSCPMSRTARSFSIGATTENPSFELNGALLSRAKVLVFKRLDDEDLEHAAEAGRDMLGRRCRLRPMRGKP